MENPDDIKSQGKVSTLYSTLVTAFSLLVLLSCASIGFLTYYLRAEGIRLEQYRLLETLRDEKIMIISEWLYERRSDINVTSKRKDIRSFCSMNKNSKNYQYERKQIQDALNLLRHEYDLEAVFLTDTQGRTTVSTENTFASMIELPLRKATLKKVIKEKEVVVSDVLISKIHNQETLFIFAPIFSQDKKEFIGMLGILTNPTQWLYTNFTQSDYLGETGEILLVNRKGVVQSPLKFQKNAVAKVVIDAQPAKRGAEGKLGRIQINDYRPEPVMAAYGYIEPFDWGIVVKQDMREINAPVYAMAVNVATVTIGVLLLALLFGILIARKISKPALSIAEAIDSIGKGALDINIPEYGPEEIRKIARNVNGMVNQLTKVRSVQSAIRELMVETGKHNNLNDLFESILPVLTRVTRSQMAVVYTSIDDFKKVELTYMYGGNTDGFQQHLQINPPDNLLTQCLHEGNVEILNGIPNIKELVINTVAGTSPVQSFMTIPLIRRGENMGVIGLASLYDFNESQIQIAEEVSTTLAQAVEICKTFELSEEMRININERNIKLQSATVELNKTAREQEILINELEDQKKQVAEANNLKSEFLSNMSHELRTPLNSVLSLTQFILMQEGELSDVDTRRRLKVVERNGKHLLTLINDILDLSKIESGKMDLFVTNFKLYDLINASVTSMQSLFDEKGIKLIIDCSPELMIESDYDRLNQILINLLSNAHKFTDKGTVTISAEQLENTVKIIVSDTGCGIPRDSLKFIFDEFRQVDGSLTRKYMGTGLGLAICKKFIALLEGTISVESTEDIGTSFIVNVPVCLNASQENVFVEYSKSESVSNGDFPIVSSGNDILIIEDNDVAADHISEALIKSGFHVTVARDGLSGLKKLKEKRPHILIVDLMIPTIDGFEVIKKVRDNPETQLLPILIVTAKDLSSEERMIISENNISQVIQKGLTHREDLIEVISTMVKESEKGTIENKKQELERQPLITNNKPKILIVEDHPDNMLLSKEILGEIDVDICEAWDGEEAIHVAEKELPDLILMDANLPKISGLDATKVIRQNSDLKNTIIIALTAKSMSGDRELFIHAGCDDYLSKPYSPNDLINKVNKWVRKAPKNK